MVTVSLVRKKNVLKEEYGRIYYDGVNIRYSGLSCVFVKYLQNGFTSKNNEIIKPQRFEEFITILKEKFSEPELLTVMQEKV